jgi:hypothetical protein
VTGQTKTKHVVFIHSNLNEIRTFIKQHKIRHSPFLRSTYGPVSIGHICEIYNNDHMVMLNLAYAESFYTIKTKEQADKIAIRRHHV